MKELEWTAKVFRLPVAPEPTIQNSVVSTIGNANRYIPIPYESSFSLVQQFYLYIIYVCAWAVIIYLSYDKRFVWAYEVGFIWGICVMLLETWLYNSASWVYVNRKNLSSYVFNAPGPIPDLKKGDDVPTELDYSGMAGGEYKILSESDTVPDDGIHGYVFPVSTYMEMSSKGEVSGTNLSEYLQGKFKSTTGFGNQDDPIFFSSKTLEVSNTGFYVAILCLTLALYINRTKWQGPNHLVWILGAVIMSLTAMGAAVSGNSVLALFNVLYIKRRLIITSCAFAMTAILISGQL